MRYSVIRYRCRPRHRPAMLPVEGPRQGHQQRLVELGGHLALCVDLP